MIRTSYIDRVRYSGFCVRGISDVKHPILLVFCARYINRKSYAERGWNAVYDFKNTYKPRCLMYGICNKNRAFSNTTHFKKKAKFLAIYVLLLFITTLYRFVFKIHDCMSWYKCSQHLLFLYEAILGNGILYL